MKACEVAVFECMGLKEGETLLIIADEPSREIGYALWEAGKSRGNEAVFVEIIPRRMHGEEPPSSVAELMKLFDVCLIPTSKSMSHTRARKEACKAGTRIATLPGITMDMMERTLAADYKKIEKISKEIAAILTGGKHVHITSPEGTDFYATIEGRDGAPDTGIYHNPGDFGNLPAGEAYIAPLEGKSWGRIVFDGSFAGIGILKDKLVFEVKDGRVVEVQGYGKEFLEEVFEKYGEDARNIAEIGIGTNPKAKIIGEVLEDEKVCGTIHIAIGNNATFGGKVDVPVHLDGVIRNPSLEVDGKKISLDFQSLFL